MFESLLGTFVSELDATRSVIRTNENLRLALIEKRKNNLKPEDGLNSIVSSCPDIFNWRRYDHCSVITRLYALYENFVKNLITDWLSLMPKLFPNYLDLPSEIRTTHRVGVGRLLQQLTRYEHLTEETTIRGFFCGVTSPETVNNEQYHLLSDAFLFPDGNLRRNTLEKLFREVGIEDTWKWIERSRDIVSLMEHIEPDSRGAAEEELRKFISDRNEAAHSTPVDKILGPSELLILCDFIEALCQALLDLVNYKIFCCLENEGKVQKIGKVSRYFPNHKVAEIKIETEEIKLAINDSVLMVNESSTIYESEPYCCLVSIKSIQYERKNKSAISLDKLDKVSIRFNREDFKKNWGIYQPLTV